MPKAIQPILVILMLCATLAGKMAQPNSSPASDTSVQTSTAKPVSSFPQVTLGGGCFWCIEAVLQRVDGIHDLVSGYMGGTVDNPTYEQICTGQTGHAEVVQFRYDPEKISYESILEWFWKMHDPTTLNRQGYDIGTQYRSVIFTHNEEQQKLAEQSRNQQNKSGQFSSPIVTQIMPTETFWPAEDYHQDYFNRNPNAGYCRAIIAPKLQKLNLR